MQQLIIISALLLCAFTYRNPILTSEENTTLLQVCQTIAARYPVNIDSQEEVSLKTFRGYFSHGGQMDQWQEGQAQISGKKEQHLETVQEIRRLLFSESFPQGSLIIDIRLLSGPSNYQYAHLSFGERIGPDIIGPRFKFTYQWPNVSEPLSLTSQTLDGVVRTRTFPGDWSISRFYDQLEVVSIKQNLQQANFKLDQNSILTYEIAGLSAWGEVRQSFSCPEELAEISL
ncbi:type VI secretion IcmF C-terminal domain-containing protein [Microbulbifer sp. ZKSA006]|uniref:type VI secretion IcmF C-terminal domain-containing protein n=1 Tax=Microbulbifer sp. ZKSA006 TaxID=3243390 RepID=UPI004039DC2E